MRAGDDAGAGVRAVAYRDHVRHRVAGRTRLLSSFLLIVTAVTITLTWTRFPTPHFALLMTIPTIVVILALLLVAQRRPDLAIVIGVLGVNLVGIAAPLGHWLAGMSAEWSLLILTAISCSAAGCLPWGWRTQALASIGPLGVYLATLYVPPEVLGWSGGLSVSGDATALAAYAVCMVGMCLTGASILDGDQFADFLLACTLRENEVELARAKDLAEAASRAKTDFLASMSHEIRTPINVIFGMTDMVLDTELNLEQRSYLQRTRVAANTLLMLINDILDFARIEARKLRLAPRPFGLRDWLQKTVAPLAGRARDQGLEMACLVDDDVPDLLVGDTDRLAQVLIHLAANALQYTRRGSIEVRVRRASGGNEAHRTLQFSIVDTGIGISEDQQREIFDAFVQGEAARALRNGGTGLGLAICSRLVRMMDGRIWVESEVGRGSRFHFTAPLLPATGEDASVAA